MKKQKQTTTAIAATTSKQTTKAATALINRAEVKETKIAAVCTSCFKDFTFRQK